MLDVAVRLIDAWWQNPTHGLMEMALSLPRHNLGALPDDNAPPTPTFYNDADSKKGLLTDAGPDKVPAWVTWGDSQIDVPTVRGYKIARQCILGVAFITAPDQDELEMNRAFGYLARGAIISAQRYNSQSNSQGLRELNGVKIHEISSVTEQRIVATDPAGRYKMWGLLEMHIIAVDTFQ